MLQRDMARPGYSSVVLVTGFPSFLAKKLVLHLVLSEPDTLVLAVVQAKHVIDARHVIDALDRHDRERIVIMEGDPSAIDLGLSGVELRQLARDVDRIHHVAHASYLGVDKKTAETLNVVGAGEIIEVARLLSQLKCLVFHSTAFVSGDRRGTVYEEDSAEDASFRNVIEETRAKAERVVRRASKSLPIAVLRPTMIVGDSGTGEVEQLDLPYLFVLLLLAAPTELSLPIPTRGEVPLHIVPIDFVVRAACAIGLDPRSPGRTFHLADPSPLPVRRFAEIIRQIRERRSAWVQLSTFARTMLRAPGVEGFVRSPKALLDQLLTNVRFDTRNADMVLGPLGIACPPLESYAEKIVATVEERLVGRASQSPETPRSVPGGPRSVPGAPGSVPGTAAEPQEGADAASQETDAMD